MWTPTPLPWRPVLVPSDAPAQLAAWTFMRYEAGLNLPGGADLLFGDEVLWAV
ncbi:MAG: hypothetical protein II997_06025 [Clostridia bacterium]|nr:hypothetical protein [Clostridia bacterium]